MPRSSRIGRNLRSRAAQPSSESCSRLLLDQVRSEAGAGPRATLGRIDRATPVPPIQRQLWHRRCKYLQRAARRGSSPRRAGM
jgi:hypothetical protein